MVFELVNQGSGDLVIELQEVYCLILIVSVDGPLRHGEPFQSVITLTDVDRLRADGRGRPPQAAARRAVLEDVEKLLTSTIYGANRTAWVRSSRHAMVAPWTWRRGQQRRL